MSMFFLVSALISGRFTFFWNSQGQSSHQRLPESRRAQAACSHSLIVTASLLQQRLLEDGFVAATRELWSGTT